MHTHPLMRRIVCAAAVLLVPTLASAQGPAAVSDSADVMQAIDQMLDALRRKDAVGLRAAFHENARMTLLRPLPTGGTRVVVLTGEQFLTSVTAPQSPAIDEPIRNVKLQIDGDLANVWAEYQVRVEGRVTHCGHDAFHLVKVSGAWKILNVSDTFRPTGCGAPW